LGLAAETNMRIANCTTAAQYFHLLRRQAALLKTDPLPLIVMTPKSLLRHPQAGSSPRDLAEGHWQPVIDDDQAARQPEDVRRLVLCSGKVYVDLVTAGQRGQSLSVAIVRLEQLYPFPENDLRTVLERYSGLSEVVWLQEEPENMGAWLAIRPCLTEVIAGRWPLSYIGRPPNSSPAEGSAAWHAANQKELVERAYTL
jgi:2-oxoglutarate dehydrogenase E1 component